MDIHPDFPKIIVALLLGAAVGLEREISDKAAGLRTNVLICVGAALFTILSSRFGVDQTRVAAQIVSGVGFLGAGAVMREGEHVTGLTTAAMIWAVAAIGMASGFGMYTLAALVAVTVLFVQLAFTQLDIMIDSWRERHTFRLTSKLDDAAFREISDIFEKSGVHVMRRKLMKKGGNYYSEWYTTGGRAVQDDIKRKLLSCASVLEVVY